MSTETGQALGRRDRQGGRQLPRLRAPDSRAGDPLARPDQGRRRPGQRRARQARRRGRRADRRRRRRGRRRRARRAVPVDVFQTGSGTSSNMNANEVIANLAGDEAHPNDHVNMGQSSNDVFPSAVHLAALGEVSADLLPALDALADALAAKAEEFSGHVKSGRTHLMDAVPVTLGQEFAGFAAQIRLGADRVRDTLGAGRSDPARRHRRGHRPQHPSRVRRAGSRRQLGEATGLEISRPRRPVRGAGQPRRPGRALRRAQGRRGLDDQDRQRPRADGLGPARRASPRSACRSCRRARRSCPARSTR